VPKEYVGEEADMTWLSKLDIKVLFTYHIVST
jgi:hypothetical protein